jgi:glycosyltransferase involved in cell wall biosynthesis
MQASDVRVALFSGNYNYVRDGANQALNLLVGHLLAAGASVRVYSPTVARPAFAPTGDLVPVPAVPMIGGRGEYKLARGLPVGPRRDLDAFAPNLIHVSAPDLLGHAALSYARRGGLPAIASLHTRFETYPRYYGVGFLEPVIARLLTRFYNRADRVLVPAPSMAALIRDWGVKTPIGIWSRGMNRDRFTPARRDPAWRRTLGIGDADMAVGFLGRLVKEKGLDVFARVIGELKRRAVAHKVLVIGEGPARDWFAEQVPEAIFAGFQSGNDLGRAVASMDVFFNPSVTETFGNVTLEAMAAGVPVVAARATGAIDLVDEGVTGYLVPPRDPEALARRLREILRRPRMAERMGIAARERVEREFTWPLVAERTAALYDEMLTRRPREPQSELDELPGAVGA